MQTIERSKMFPYSRTAMAVIVLSLLLGSLLLFVQVGSAEPTGNFGGGSTGSTDCSAKPKCVTDVNGKHHDPNGFTQGPL